MSSIKKNLLYQMVYEILIILMPLISSPYISRVLGADAIGVYSYTYSMAYYFVLFAMLGISNYGNRLIATVKEDRNRLNKEFSSLFAVHFAFSVIMLLIYIVYCLFIVSEQERVFALIQALFVASAIFDVNWLFFGLEEFKLSVTRNTIIKIASFACIFFFVKKKTDLHVYCFIMAAGIFASQLAVWPFVKRYVSFVRVEKKDILKHIKPLFVLFIPVLAVSIYKIMDKIMLGQMDSRRSLGYYENSEKIVSVFVTAISAFGTVMMPRMNNLFSKGTSETGNQYLRRSMRWMLIITYAVAFGVMGISPNFVVIFWGKGFAECASVLSILVCSLPFVAFASVIRMQYLIPKHMDREYILSVSGGAVINLVINYLLIPQYGGAGAAVGTLFAEGFVCIFQAWCIRKETDALVYLAKSTPFILLGVIMFFAVRSIGNIMNLGLIPELIIQIAIGAAVYLAFGCFILRKEITVFIKQKQV